MSSPDAKKRANDGEKEQAAAPKKTGDQRESPADPGNPDMFAGGRAVRGDDAVIADSAHLL